MPCSFLQQLRVSSNDIREWVAILINDSAVRKLYIHDHDVYKVE